MNKQVLKSTIFVPAEGKVFLHYILHYIIMNIDIPDIIVLFCAALQAGLWDISHSGEDVGSQGAQVG